MCTGESSANPDVSDEQPATSLNRNLDLQRELLLQAIYGIDRRARISERVVNSGPLRTPRTRTRPQSACSSRSQRASPKRPQSGMPHRPGFPYTCDGDETSTVAPSEASPARVRCSTPASPSSARPSSAGRVNTPRRVMKSPPASLNLDLNAGSEHQSNFRATSVPMQHVAQPSPPRHIGPPPPPQLVAERRRASPRKVSKPRTTAPTCWDQDTRVAPVWAPTPSYWDTHGCGGGRFGSSPSPADCAPQRPISDGQPERRARGLLMRPGPATQKVQAASIYTSGLKQERWAHPPPQSGVPVARVGI